MPMNIIRFRLCPPLLRNCALALISAAALQSAASGQPIPDPRLPQIESAQIAQDPSNGQSTARLKDVSEGFEFQSQNHIGFMRECYGMNFPSDPWPKGCIISFSGPAIVAAYGAKGVVRVMCSPKRYPFDIGGTQVNLGAVQLQ
jgi:hypothetical protein